jgi:hypothetical protein
MTKKEIRKKFEDIKEINEILCYMFAYEFKKDMLLQLEELLNDELEEELGDNIIKVKSDTKKLIIFIDNLKIGYLNLETRKVNGYYYDKTGYMLNVKDYKVVLNKKLTDDEILTNYVFAKLVN